VILVGMLALGLLVLAVSSALVQALQQKSCVAGLDVILVGVLAVWLLGGRYLSCAVLSQSVCLECAFRHLSHAPCTCVSKGMRRPCLTS
jgi:hypothetical protein